MNRSHRIFFLCLSLLSTSVCNHVLAQEHTAEWQLAIEGFLDMLDIDSETTSQEVFDQFAAWYEDPLDMNRDPLEPLADLALITPVQLQAIDAHLIRHGPLISLYELQSIEALDSATIRRILPFVHLRKSLRDFHVPLGRMLLEGQHEFQGRWQQFLEPARGFLAKQDSSRQGFLGSPGRLYLRYQKKYANRLSMGLTAEKDPGEPFFQRPNAAGFDFYSVHFYMKEYRRWLKEIALGDYRINIGQGLIFASGYGSGKSSLATRIKSRHPSIRPARSSSESGFLRGIAATFRLPLNMELGVFTSLRQRDASIRTDSVKLAGDSLTITHTFSAFNDAGLHRTRNELKNKGTVLHGISGIRLRYDRRWFNANLQLISHRLDQSMDPGGSTYQKYRPKGKSFTNASLDYTVKWRNLNFFGETAIDRNGNVATVNGLLLGLDRQIHFAILVRAYPRGFQTLVSGPFSEAGASANEQGIYFGIEIAPQKRFRVQAYADFWRHPWLRYQVDAPSSGAEQLLRIEYFIKRKWTAYLQFKRETRQKNQPGAWNRVNALADQQKTQLRLHSSLKLSKSLELRNRIELSGFRIGAGPKQNGFLVFHDLVYKPMGKPISCTMRFALFDTDGYDSRIYAYENDVINSFSIPPYFYRGQRYYLNIRYKGIRNWIIELRFARTEMANRHTIGSGLNEIMSRHRTEVKLQVIHRWQTGRQRS